MIAPRIVAIAAGAAMLILAGIGIVQTFRLLSTQAALSAEQRGRADDRAAYAQAQAEAMDEALALKLKRETEDAKNAELADDRFVALRERYAALLRGKAAGGAASNADLPGAAGGAGLPETGAGGTGIPVGTMIVSQADALICADNTAYAQAAHGWVMGIGQN